MPTRWGALLALMAGTVALPHPLSALTLEASCLMRVTAIPTIINTGLAEVKDGGNVVDGLNIVGWIKTFEDSVEYQMKTYSDPGSVSPSMFKTANENKCYAGKINADTIWNFEITVDCSNIDCYIVVEMPPASPILIDLENDGFHLVGVEDAVEFDIDADGIVDRLSWTAAETRDAFLVLDRNHNGVIDDGGELFGNATTLANGRRATNGYEALNEFDRREFGGNGDHLIDRLDAVFEKLGLWVDSNHNGFAEGREISSLKAEKVESINLNYQFSEVQDDFGNRFLFNSTAWMKRGRNVVRIWTTDVFFVQAD